MAMSVGHTPSPEQPDYRAEEVLDSIRSRYDLQTDDDWREMFDMKVSELYSWVAEHLERDMDDINRLEEEMYKDALVDHEYIEDAWVEDEDANFRQGYDKKRRYCLSFRDSENEDAWILFSETEFLEED